MWAGGASVYAWVLAGCTHPGPDLVMRALALAGVYAVKVCIVFVGRKAPDLAGRTRSGPGLVMRAWALAGMYVVKVRIGFVERKAPGQRSPWSAHIQMSIVQANAPCRHAYPIASYSHKTLSIHRRLSLNVSSLRAAPVVSARK